MQKDPNKVKALEAAIAQIEKNYGQGSIMKLGDTSHMQVESVPTGSLVVFRRDVSWRFTVRSPVVRRRLRFIW